MAPKAVRDGSRPSRTFPLLAALAVIALVYVALLPKLRHIQAETERMRRDRERRETALTQTMRTAGSLDAARAAVAMSPNDQGAKMKLAAALVAAGKSDEALDYVRQCAGQA